MVYIKWILCVPATLIMSIVGRLLAPILPLFCNDGGWLPDWLSWFQTPDNSCDGDSGHKTRWPKDGFFWTYARRVAWLLRNVAYGFDIDVLGVEILPTDEMVVEGNPNIGEVIGISGTCVRYCYRNGKLIAFQFFYVKHYQLFGRWSRCVRINLGWKLWNAPPYVAQHTCFFNPVK